MKLKKVIISIIALCSILGMYVIYQQLDQRQARQLNTVQDTVMQTDAIKTDDVVICGTAANSTPCVYNADCRTGTCYGGLCEDCIEDGLFCNNPGQCCSNSCQTGICGGDGIVTLVTAIVVPTAIASAKDYILETGKAAFNKVYGTPFEAEAKTQMNDLSATDAVIDQQQIELDEDEFYEDYYPEVEYDEEEVEEVTEEVVPEIETTADVLVDDAAEELFAVTADATLELGESLLILGGACAD